MQPYNFKVQYIPGSENIADTLSRLIHENDTHRTDNSLKTEDYMRFVATQSMFTAMTTREMEHLRVRPRTESGMRLPCKWTTA
jgi:DNA-directed RNA polymerase